MTVTYIVHCTHDAVCVLTVSSSGNAPIGTSADIYAFGICALEASTAYIYNVHVHVANIHVACPASPHNMVFHVDVGVDVRTCRCTVGATA